MPIKVLVIDDSPFSRALLTEILNAVSDIVVVDCAVDAYDARHKIKTLNPDILTLDIEMPQMNGITFLRNLMRLRPMPVIMVSTLTQAGAPATLQGLELGALDYVAKPRHKTEVNVFAETLIDKVRAAALASVKRMQASKMTSLPDTISNELQFNPDYLLAMGASTGGIEAIKMIVQTFPAHMCPVVVTQHIPPIFSTLFAKRLNNLCQMTVCEAEHGQKLQFGHIYIAPGEQHLTIKKMASGYICQLSSADRVKGHRPSVDVLFKSVAEQASGQATGIILTGMGDDGAKGLLAMKYAKCNTIAQDKATSIVWGMPGAAVKLNAAQKVIALQKIAKVAIENALT